MKTYRFYKIGTEWYIDLPEYIQQGGSIADLQMVDGADKMLDMIAKKEDSVHLAISKESFPGADSLELKEKCDPYIGGGYYIMNKFEGTIINQTMWLCQVTDFVFGDIPQQIFFKRMVL